jgi:poly-gamma-glutamate synthesis protein (capsule biosynthesis protein)
VQAERIGRDKARLIAEWQGGHGVPFSRLKNMRNQIEAGAVRRLPRVLVLIGAVAVVCVVGTAAASGLLGGGAATPSPKSSMVMTPTPWAKVAAASPALTPAPTPTPTPAPFPVVVIARYDYAPTSISQANLTAALAAGKITLPCELLGLSYGATILAISSSTPCLPATQIVATVHKTAGLMALLPPGLVTPSVKVLAVGDADLFGGPNRRSQAYMLYGVVATPADWTAYDSNDVRTLISTGDTCPDRGVSYEADFMKKGWDWVLDGGTVHYRGTKPDPYGWGWEVPIIARNGDSGQLAALISDNDVSANDFECPMIKDWVQHNDGMVFNIDPRVAPLLAKTGGLKVVTLGSNHITDAGRSGILETIDYLDAAGIKHTGAGKTLADALAPAVVDVRGVTFAFVGWDDITGSAAATATNPGVAPLTTDNACNSIKAAKEVADIVIAMPQWGWPEYHANITSDQEKQRALFYSCGADDILGSGTHWASWASVLPGPNGPQFAIGSHGNFLFDQSWSRQTMEGVVVEATFYGKKLVQFRLHPYVVVQGAQPNLVDPATDGAYVLHQVWSVSEIK